MSTTWKTRLTPPNSGKGSKVRRPWGKLPSALASTSPERQDSWLMILPCFDIWPICTHPIHGIVKVFVHSLPLFKGSVVTHEFRSKLPAKQCLANCFKRPQRSFPSKPPTNAIPFRENIRPSSVPCKNAWKRELERTRMAYQHVLKLSEVEQLPAIFSTYSHPTVLTAQKVTPSLLARRLLLVSSSKQT